MKHGNNGIKTLAVLALALTSSFLLWGCDLMGNFFSPSRAMVFAVDSSNGSVYEIALSASSRIYEAGAAPIVSVQQNSAGELAFQDGKAFMAVGSYNNTAPGLYWFDPSSAAPSASRMGAGPGGPASGAISAQYVEFASSTLGFVSSADYSGVYPDAVFTFDPSRPAAGLGAAVSGLPTGAFPQGIAVSGGHAYVADNFNAKVYRLDSAGGSGGGFSVEATYTASRGGTTGLLAGYYDADRDGTAEPGVFVANSGGYDALTWAALPGSIDFIPSGSAAATPTTLLQGISVAHIASFDSNTLIATNYGSTYIIALTSSGAVATEVKNASGASFGSFDADVHEGYAYVPDGARKVYRVSRSGTAEAITVGSATQMVTNVGIRR